MEGHNENYSKQRLCHSGVFQDILFYTYEHFPIDCVVLLEKHFYFYRDQLQGNAAVCYWYCSRFLYKIFVFKSWGIQGGNDINENESSDDWTSVQKGKYCSRLLKLYRKENGNILYIVRILNNLSTSDINRLQFKLEKSF